MRIRKLAVVVVSGVTLGGLTAGSPAAWAHEAHSEANHDGDDFTVFGRFTDFDRQDNGEEGWSEGDEVSFAYDLFQRGEGQVGDGDGTCVITQLDKDDHEFEADCDGAFDLDDGRLDLEGTVSDDDFRDGSIELDVVDGTGDYEDAAGTVTFSRAGEKHDGGGHHHAAMQDGVGHHGGAKHGGGEHDGHGGRWFKADVDLD